MGMPEVKEKCVEHILFFIAYTGKSGLGFGQIMWKIKGDIQVIQVPYIPPTLSEYRVHASFPTCSLVV